MMSNKTIVVATNHQISTGLSNEVVILSLESGIYFGLEETGAYIWSLLEKPLSIQKIIEKMVERYEIDQETCKRDVDELLSELLAHKLIDIVSPG